MFIVSKKLGLLGIVIPVGISVIAVLISENIFTKYHFPSDLLVGICFVISSLIIWILGSKLNGNRHGEIMYPIQEPKPSNPKNILYSGYLWNIIPYRYSY
jgi:hypothetical protein